jgi:hypothetical protein
MCSPLAPSPLLTTMMVALSTTMSINSTTMFWTATLLRRLLTVVEQLPSLSAKAPLTTGEFALLLLVLLARSPKPSLSPLVRLLWQLTSAQPTVRTLELQSPSIGPATTKPTSSGLSNCPLIQPSPPTAPRRSTQRRTLGMA